ncbi:AraC-type DNA-binding protein [Sinosporangium album]|uniref:AraC-type DNA-binding protein n=1 Tax=Sinosporangium album TaxID=504805 RepID=A0A1G8IZV8_9ACTN|nr:AraC family transcriptional regulator [Sinosporangium album]SDI24000.1 AraC-type DNA-binding protein [Sinosporangium album]
MSISGVPSHFLRTAVASVEATGADVRHAIRHPFTASHVDCDQAVDVMRALWHATGDELLGLGPRPVPPGTFRMIALGLIHTPDLRSSLERLVEFTAITTGYTRSRLVVDGTAARIEIATDTEVRPLAAEITVALVHRFPAWLVAQRIALTALQLPFPEPDYSAEYAPIFGVTPVFDAPAVSLTFDARYLAAPVVRNERELLSYIRRSPADLIYHRDYGTTTADRVRSIIERGDMSSWARAEDVAARLSISVQHMRRLLREEGTSFNKIREELLRDLAVDSLRRGGESIDEISYRLGFSEPSAFRRAFTRWVGTPPGEYRHSLITTAATTPARHNQAKTSPITR